MRKVLFLFGIMNDQDVDWMISAGSVRKIPAGTVLIEQGREIDSVYIVLDGMLSVSAREVRLPEIARLHAGEVVGEMSFVDSRPPSATVTAVEDSHVLAIPRPDLKKKLEQVDFASRFYKALSVFMADRLRANVARFGYGKIEPAPESGESEGDIDPAVLDTVSVAGARFDHLLRQVRRG